MKVSSYTSAESLCKWIFEYADFGIIITDNELNITDVNNWIENNSGKAADFLKGKKILEVFPEIRERKLDHFLNEAREGASVILTALFHKYFLRFPVAGKQGEEMKQTVRISPLFNSEFVSKVIIHIEDVTDRVDREEQMNKKNEELQELNAMKDKFFRIVAHDLRSPFVSILGLTDILKSDMSLTPEKTTEIIDMIYSSVRDQYNFLENLLKWSKLQSGHFEMTFSEVTLKDIIKHILSIAGPSIKSKKILATYDNIPEDLALFTDRQALTSILYNLIFNALKFTNENGKIEISAQKENDETHISVIDNGVGITEDRLQKLFVPGEFISTPGTKREKGSGMGLILVKELVGMLGGKIWVKSFPGSGSTFTISFPSAPPEESK
jgi:PAS domain S-box-containing protein